MVDIIIITTPRITNKIAKIKKAYVFHFLLLTPLLEKFCLFISYRQKATARATPGKMNDDRVLGTAPIKLKIIEMLGRTIASAILATCNRLVCNQKT